ncbi:MAG: NrsF family protein [Myxococcota bacterium]|nr:NrsF family protein [Myxococcota bacterium]
MSAEPPTLASDPDVVRARILELARREPSPTRHALKVQRTLIAIALVTLPVLAFLAWGGARGEPRPTSLLFDTASGASAIAALASWVAFARGGSVLGRSRRALIAVALATPLALLFWKCGVSACYPGMMAEWVERPGLRCLRLSCLLSIVPLLGALWVLRQSDPVHPRALGMAIGAAVGGSSWVLVDLWCPVAYLPHLLLGHVLPVSLAIAVGALFGGRMLAPRRE